jgi:hypothetical protein
VFAQALAYVGEIDLAFDFLQRSLPESTVDLQTSYPHPLYDALREDPRWQKILAQIGRSSAQLADIPFSLDAVRERLIGTATHAGPGDTDLARGAQSIAAF